MATQLKNLSDVLEPTYIQTWKSVSTQPAPQGQETAKIKRIFTDFNASIEDWWSSATKLERVFSNPKEIELLKATLIRLKALPDGEKCVQNLLKKVISSGNDAKASLVFETLKEFLSTNFIIPEPECIRSACEKHLSALLLLFIKEKYHVHGIIDEKKQMYFIHLACKYDLPSVVQELLKIPVKTDVISKFGSNPLHLACKAGGTDTIKLLFALADGNALIAQQNKVGQTPLHLLCGTKKTHLAKVLIDKKKDVCHLADAKNRTPFQFACEVGDLEMVHFLHTFAKKEEIPYALFLACEKGHREVVEFLLSQADKIDCKTHNPIYAALINKKVQLIPLLFGSSKLMEDHFDSKFPHDVYRELSYLGLACSCDFSDDILNLIIHKCYVERKAILSADDLFVLCSKRKNRLILPHLERIDSKIKPDAVDAKKNTLTHAACKVLDEDLLKFLVFRSLMSLNSNEEGETPVHIACGEGFDAGLEILRKFGSQKDLNAIDKKNNTPAHAAAQNGRTSIIKSLKALSVDFSKKNTDGLPPLQVALKKDYFEIAFQIISFDKGLLKGIDPALLLPLITYLVSKDILEETIETKEIIHILTLLLSVIPTERWIEGNHPLHTSAVSGNYSMLKLLIEYAEKIGKRDLLLNKTYAGNTLLETCLAHKHVGCALLLLSKKPSKEGLGSKALNLACQHQLYTLARILLALQLDPKSVEKSHCAALFCAALQAGNQELCQQMLAVLTPEELNRVDIHGRTPLHYACMSLNTQEFALKILEKGKIDFVRDRRGRFPLHYACEKGQQDVAVKMIQLGANIQKADYSKQTPLHLACLSGLEAVALLLIQRGAKTNVRDERRIPALHYALDARLQSVCLELLKTWAPADDYVDYFGNFPLLLAIDNQLPDLFEAIVASSDKAKLKKTIDDCGLELLVLACEKSLFAGAVRLIELGVNPDLLSPILKKKLIVYFDQVGLKPLLDRLCASTKNPFEFRDTKPSEIHTAIEKEMIQWFKSLIGDAKANLEVKNAQGQTPLHLTCQLGLLNYARALVEKGAKLDAVDNKKRTPLHLACFFRYSELAAFLIEKNGANPFRNDEDEKNPLTIAMEKRLYALIPAFLHKKQLKKGIMDADLEKIVDWAALTGQIDLLNLLILKDFPDDVLAKELQAFAFEKMPCEAFLSLLHARKVPFLSLTKDNQDKTLETHYACWDRERTYDNFMPRMLPMIGMDGRHGNALAIACRYNHYEAALLLNFLMPNLNKVKLGGMPFPLYEAAHSRTKLMRHLLDNHVGNVKSKDPKGNIPLHLVCTFSYNARLVKFLLERDSNVDEVNLIGNTALHELAYRKPDDYLSPNIKEFFQLLIRHNAKNNIRNKLGRTPLHIACDNKNVIAAGWLVSIAIRHLKGINSRLNEIGRLTKQEKDQIMALSRCQNAPKKSQADGEYISKLEANVEDIKKQITLKKKEIEELEVKSEGWRYSLNFVDSNNVKPNLSLLFNLESDSDRVLKVGPGQVRFFVNSYILGARSKYFYKLFNPDFSGIHYKDNDAKEIAFPEEDPELFKTCLEYFYSNQLGINGENWIALWHKADFFSEDEGFIETIQKWIESNLSEIDKELAMDNFIHIAEMLLHKNIPSLNKILNAWILKNIETVELTPGNYTTLVQYLFHLKMTGDVENVGEHPLKMKILAWLIRPEEVHLDYRILTLLVNYPGLLNLNVPAFKGKVIQFLTQNPMEITQENYISLMKILIYFELESPTYRKNFEGWIEGNSQLLIGNKMHKDLILQFLKFFRFDCPLIESSLKKS